MILVNKTRKMMKMMKMMNLKKMLVKMVPKLKRGLRKSKINFRKAYFKSSMNY